MNRKLFEMFDGTPAHTMIVVGLTLSLLAPIIVHFKAASVARIRTESEQMSEFADLEMQAKERKWAQEEKADDKNDKLTADEKSKRAEARDKARDDLKESLDSKYDQIGKKRELLEAEADLA